MRQIDHMLIIAGPTASGKSTLTKELVAGRLAPLKMRIGINNLNEWPRMASGSVLRRTDLELKQLILHYDFLWSYPGSNGDMLGGQRALSIMDDARELSFVTIWTPPVRLERQLIEGRLRVPMPATFIQVLKARVFRMLPHFAIVGVSKIPPLKQINRWLPGHPIINHLLALRVYSKPDQVAATYRLWLQFCDRHISKTRAHVIVEFDRELKFYSRAEWETHIRMYKGD